eukprot:scaffold243960_cov45-Prasinocladus_malaysianus.AAC.2
MSKRCTYIYTCSFPRSIGASRWRRSYIDEHRIQCQHDNFRLFGFIFVELYLGADTVSSAPEKTTEVAGSCLEAAVTAHGFVFAASSGAEAAAAADWARWGREVLSRGFDCVCRVLWEQRAFAGQLRGLKAKLEVSNATSPIISTRGGFINRDP